MKKTVSMKLMAALVMLLAPLLMGATEHITYTATYGGSPTLGTRTLGGATYTTVKYEGVFNRGESGAPSLPVDIIQFSVPWNATNFSVTATPTMGDPIVLDYPVYPIQSNATQVTLPDNTSYSGTYPSTMAWYVDEGLYAGENHVVTVAVMPMRCDHSNGTVLKVIESINLTLNYELIETPSIHPIARKGVSLREEGYEWVESLVVNPTDVRDNAFSSTSNMKYHPIVNDEVEDPFTYIIITTPELKKSMRRLSALRMQKGIPTKILSVAEAMNDSMAVLYDPIDSPEFFHIYYDNAEKIRNTLRAYYVDHGCRYILLAGSDVPYRDTPYGQTDTYYGDLMGYWESYYCNKPSDLRVGRLLGRQPKQFDNYINKLLKYELNPGNGDYTYLSRTISIGLTGVRDNSVNNGVNTTGLSDEPRTDLTGQEVIDFIRTNLYGLATIFQIGFPSGVELYYYEQMPNFHYIWAIDSVKVAPNVFDNEIGNGFNCMENTDYPMLCTSLYGPTIPYSTDNNYNIQFNCGESFTMGQDYGGPAYVGATDQVDFGEAMAFEYYLLEKLDEYDISGALQHVKMRYSPRVEVHAEVICNYNLLGDPYIKKWPDTPQEYSNITISRTDDAVIISSDNTLNAVIGYHSNDGTTGHVTITNSSITLNDVSPNSTLMLYNRDHIPYIAPLVLQNTTLENSQYVIASEVTAGKAVDANRTRGNVTVADGAEYEIEASGKVTLAGGFNVERGALFSVQKSTYK